MVFAAAHAGPDASSGEDGEADALYCLENGAYFCDIAN